MTRVPSTTRRLARLLLVLPLLACKPACDFDAAPPTLGCDRVTLRIQPGQCVMISNPCFSPEYPDWNRFDSFRLCDAPEGLSLQTRTLPDSRARFVCASSTMARSEGVPVDYYYARGGDFGEGQFQVIVGASIDLFVFAAPPTVAPGETTRLLVAVAGNGRPPYSYSWSPAQWLDNPTIATPIASPLNTTTFTVTVTDQDGLTAQSAVTVTVGLGVNASATPSTIDPGQSTTLLAVPLSGTGPYTYSWTPTASLDNSALEAPTATPARSTRYTVVVTDANGEAGSGDVWVTVNLLVSASASPASVAGGDQSQLAAAVQGGSPPYTYSWTPAASLDDPSIPNPVANPPATTAYTVTVTDAAGTQVSAQTVVEVIPSSSLTACFTTEQTTFGPFAWDVQADGSCSTGPIATYRWWADFNFAGQLPTHVSASPLPPAFSYEEPGVYDVRLEVEDAMGNTHSVVVPITVIQDPPPRQDDEQQEEPR
jgi:hypothetical protein